MRQAQSNNPSQKLVRTYEIGAWLHLANAGAAVTPRGRPLLYRLQFEQMSGNPTFGLTFRLRFVLAVMDRASELVLAPSTLSSCGTEAALGWR